MTTTDQPATGETPVPRYAVTLDTPQGRAVLEVPTFQGPDAAGRRAWMAALGQRWGDVDDVTVVSVVPLDGTPAGA